MRILFAHLSHTLGPLAVSQPCSVGSTFSYPAVQSQAPHGQPAWCLRTCSHRRFCFLPRRLVAVLGGSDLEDSEPRCQALFPLLGLLGDRIQGLGVELAASGLASVVVTVLAAW